MEVLAGGSGRRRWPDEVKGRIVVESFRPEALVSEVARRHGIAPQQLTGWRRAAREGRLVLPWDDHGPGFVPIVVDEADRGVGDGKAAGEARPKASMSGAIEIEVGGIVLRLPLDTSPERIAAVVAALKASA
jgi:transposase